ncbi:MAG: hypothetical protein ABSF36_04605 [Candidatus Methanomethylicaceae archaeon]
MPSLSGIRSRFLLATLSIFYDVAFVDRVWTDPDFMRTTIGLVGIFITALVGIAYSVARLAFALGTSPLADSVLLLGIFLFVVGSWGGRINIGFDIANSKETLQSRGTVFCVLSDTRQSSSFIEVLINKTQDPAAGNDLKASECNLVFASEIWGESLAKKGLNLLGEVFTNRNKGDVIAR